MKMSLMFEMRIGEAEIFAIRAKTTNKTVENAVRTSRGLNVFNKMQENLQIKARSFLPNAVKMFKNWVSIFKEEDFSSIINLRHKKESENRESKLGLKDKVDKDKKDESIVWDEQSKVNNNLTKEMFEENTFFHKSFFSVRQSLFSIKIISSVFLNNHKLDFDKYFVLYFKELHERHDYFSRSQYPLMVQTFNTFNIFYLETVYEVQNFLCMFYVWLRLIDKFHNSKIDGVDISELYKSIFEDMNFFENNCRKSYSQILESQIEELKNKTKQKIEKEEEKKANAAASEIFKDQSIPQTKPKKKPKINFVT